ncbi:MAG: peptide chain release factor N(5)-glutamine methyltransferase [Dysgonamonadaceae bacterium]|jgi:release factor glutamine methyltransferase|nr:peptide chain release factor N(5)-glutamine methyltransferase [Dysgonamonadaceae bacterium]MDD3309327.1 peptide chain release factor N(5)-glutamine methyltransferase [Dysgonamonadaceae bacterium]MDD3901126.1 peptide chain release factor N(5)-glutamine methyltransferase [Dysgonamonadaceae bacterium]MDD4399417.1 peptide chain release factor N(5)-glutamine methyltransferase [Dysgonamonadaceae bacterium]MEA5082146.1 peptide chain release factor N(5)-glutamine methyltransferase [Dysgonamonadaceae
MNQSEYIATYFSRELSGYYPNDEIKTITRLVLKEVCGISPSDLFSCKITILSDAEKQKLDDIIIRLKNQEPLQYILEETRFYGLSFHVNSLVLIPRPETEELVEWVISEKDDKTKRILDIGTGSGCIAVALAKMIPSSYIEAWDISAGALNVAQENAERNMVNVTFKQINVLEYSFNDDKFDVIVSNPPYVTESEKHDMDSNVLDFEPKTALFVPDNNALIFYERIADIALKRLNSNGKLYFEINRSKGIEMVEMLIQKGFHNVELRKDISGNDRMIRAQINW